MNAKLKKALKDNGFGDLDPVTGPQNNPNYLHEWQQVKAFLGAAEAHANPWEDTPFEEPEFADPRLDPASEHYVG